MTVLVLLLLLVVVAGVAVAVGAKRVGRGAERANEVVPGTPSRAPAAWAGAHTPEALLHRRLRAAVEAARAKPREAGFIEVKAAVERGALELDDRLIAAAALPAPHNVAAVAAIEPAVVALENAVAGASDAPGSTAQPALDAAVADAQSRLDAIAAARVEVDQLDITQTRPEPGGAAPTG